MQIAGKGFSIVEVLSTCPTNWGLSPIEAIKWVEDNMLATYPLAILKERIWRCKQMHQDIIIAGFEVREYSQPEDFWLLQECLKTRMYHGFHPRPRNERGNSNCHVIISDKPVGSILNSATAQ